MSLPPLVHRRDAGDCRLFSSTQNYLNTKRVSAARHPWPYLITFLQKATTKKPTTIRQFSSAMDTFPIQRSSERQFLMVTHLASKPPLATAIALVFLVNIGKVVSKAQFPIVIFKLRMRKWRPMRISVDLAWGRRRGGRVLGPDLQLQHLTGLREKLDTCLAQFLAFLHFCKCEVRTSSFRRPSPPRTPVFGSTAAFSLNIHFRDKLEGTTAPKWSSSLKA